ncbi:hypothetical protein NL108_012552 [Boleophthalmus pectinirostris]|uniref:calcineurin B homologous protein 1-like isoform X1 n=1 Tax=Boleophthalmus pectinirostris TaxID=150288 RepID=UPI000A1C4EB4|nr:calcineurin B homologous protein 1-like isoform X1 [Boleophthalmus pectinirostris]KAJ0063853.1 hypothetical protein NL108_012552 [Boleophthalmus pectinirostris]
MGSNKSTIPPIPNAQELMQETGFSASHIQSLYERFEQLDQDGRGALRVEDFEVLSGLAVNPIKDRIIGAFFSPGKDSVDFPSFVRVMAHFQWSGSNRNKTSSQDAYNSPNSKLRFLFQLYDQDRDEKISRGEMLQVLQEMLGMEDEQLQSIVEKAIQEADLDQDGAISFDEFKKCLEKVNIDEKMKIGFLC